MYRLKFRSILAIAALSLTACLEEERTEQIGYFKSEEPHRVLSFYATEKFSEAEAREVFDGLPHTAGRMTQAVIYSGRREGAVADGLTFARTMGEALALISNPPFDGWDWRIIITPGGERRIYAKQAE